MYQQYSNTVPRTPPATGVVIPYNSLEKPYEVPTLEELHILRLHIVFMSSVSTLPYSW